jgi:hypothetical protein
VRSEITSPNLTWRSTRGPPPEGTAEDIRVRGRRGRAATAYGFQSYSDILLGLALKLHGLAIARGTGYPRWLDYPAIGSAAWITHGLMVAHIGLFDPIPRLVARPVRRRHRAPHVAPQPSTVDRRPGASRQRPPNPSPGTQPPAGPGVPIHGS